MASWVFCNCCFQRPRPKSSFSLTNCGHVYCDACLSQGKKDECLICKVPCRTVLLSKHTDANIQEFFMGIDGLCRKYSQETSQVSEFQEKHRKRLLAFYREKILQLEESLQRSVLQLEQIQSMRSSQRTAFSVLRNSSATRPDGYVRLPPDASAPDRVESMEVDFAPSPMRRPEGVVGPSRISLISPPQDGRMGSHHCRCPHLCQCPSCQAKQEEGDHPALGASQPCPGRPSASRACYRGKAQASAGRHSSFKEGTLENMSEDTVCSFPGPDAGIMRGRSFAGSNH